MKTKKILALLVAICVAVVMMPTMAFADDAVTTSAPADTIATAPADTVILATSDVHCYIDDNLGYATVAAYKKALEASGSNVILVDNGDAIQGGTIGTLSKGESIIEIMNAVGYDVVTIGNHEFDYGMDQFLNVIRKKSNATYVSCNFRSISDSKPVLDPYVIKEVNGKKIAFLGISTPETYTKSSPVYFQDENGNWIYDFCNDTDGSALVKQVQTYIDAAKKDGADYVIAMGHLGDDSDTNAYWRSDFIIKNTTGISAFIDGHAHHVVTTTVQDKSGVSVPLLQTGEYLKNIGKITISGTTGAITIENVDGTVATEKDADVQKVIDKVHADSDVLLNQVVAKSAVKLTIYDDNENRLVRKQETNIGDLCADAYRVVGNADVAFVNGGGVRADIAAGDVTYGNIIAVHPFGNKLTVVEATGQEILDALEMASRSVGTGENGGFLQVSGLTYTINPGITSSVVLDDKGMFVKVDGAYRVSNVTVGGEPLDLAKTYTVASHNYMLKEGGDGINMFTDNKILQDEVMLDNQVLITYITDYLNGAIGREYAEPQGRITILSLDNYNTLKAEVATTKAKLEVAEYAPIVKAVGAKNSVKLTWNACTASGVKYQVFQSAKKTGFKKVATVTGTVKTVKKLTSGKLYYFKVRAVKTIDGSLYAGHFSKIKYARAK